MNGRTVDEHVVLVDEAGRAVGTAPKRDVHHRSTPLHLAFSCYLFDGRGRLLLARRAVHKPTWPGVWTNSCCGHPAAGEPVADAVRRRVRQELGVEVDRLQLVLPAFRYHATMSDGTRENELCPVFAATCVGELTPDPDEVADLRWVDWAGFRDDVLTGRAEVSPWCSEQVVALAEVEVGPGCFREGTRDQLPEAARG